MKLIDVRYLTEDPGKEWSNFLNQQTDLESFKENLEEWQGLVDDVENTIEKWTPQDFDDFKKSLKLERKGIFMGEKNALRFCVVMMPELMFKATVLAQQFVAPWGTAVIRLVEHDEKFLHLKSELLK